MFRHHGLIAATPLLNRIGADLATDIASHALEIAGCEARLDGRGRCRTINRTTDGLFPKADASVMTP